MSRQTIYTGAILLSTVLLLWAVPGTADDGDAIDLLGQARSILEEGASQLEESGAEHPVYSLRPEPFSDEDAVILSLEELLDLTISNNIGLQQQEFTIEKGHYSVDQTYYAYDPTYNLSAGIGWSEQDTAGLRVRGTSYSTSAGVSVPREYGDSFQVSLSHDASDTDADSTDYSSVLSISYKRPLGQGAGKYYHRINRFIQSNSLQLSYDRLDDDVRNLKGDVLDIYYQAVAARASISVREASLDVALQQLERTVERYKVGLAIRVDLLQAENSVLNQRTSLLEARKNYDELLDSLAALTGIPRELKLSVDSETSLPEFPDELPADLWDLVVTNSYELKSLNTQLANLRLQRDQQLHQLKPDLNLGVSYSRSDASEDPTTALGAADNQSVGVNLSWSTTPGKRSARADLAQTEIDLASLDLSIQDLELRLKTNLRSQQRDLSTLRKQIDIARSNVEVVKETYEIQKERNGVGLATTLDVIEAQENVLSAELSLLSARVSYQQAYRQVLLSAGLI